MRRRKIAAARGAARAGGGCGPPGRPRRGGREDRPKELRGRGGLDPVRYGDWEKDGLASDF